MMDTHHWEMVERLKTMPGVIGIIVHGGYSDNPRHLSDESSDLDFTVVIDGEQFPKSDVDCRSFVPWINFKSYQLMSDNSPVEVDTYYFDINDTREWDMGTKEGYAYSASLIYDPTGVVQPWLDKKTELTLSSRNQVITCLMQKAEKLYKDAENANSVVDKNITLTKVVKNLVEVIFYINWEYPPDQKWRTSVASNLEWHPDELLTLLRRGNQTFKDDIRMDNINKLFQIIRDKLEDEGDFMEQNSVIEKHCHPVSSDIKIARLFTRIDKYSWHSVKKCIKRGLPWNAHDLISTGVDNVIDILYLLNDEAIPQKGKFEGLSDLRWMPKNWNRYLYQATMVSNYEDADDALERADALRKLYISVTEKIESMNLFSTASLYADDFMNEDLFTETSPYMRVFQDGGYMNRQQLDDTLAAQLLKKVKLSSNYERNLLWGMCSQFLIADEREFTSFDKEKLNAPYLPVWEKVVAQLTKEN